MDRDSFGRLCFLLEHVGGLRHERYVAVPEKVASFLLILAHHTKNRIVKHNFKRSGYTVSKYFSETLKALVKISGLLLVQPEPVGDDCTNETWKYFKGCLGALDGTYIEVHVPQVDQARYRSRKGLPSVNVLRVCDQNMNFVYVLAGWQGFAADNRVLRDALSTLHGLHVPRGNFYLCDAEYMNSEGFLSLYCGIRYHLQDWRSGPSSPENAKEFLNLKHAKARNVIERAFGILKGRWAILRSPNFYPIKTQNFIILACALLHNFIPSSMSHDPLEEIDVNGSVNDDDSGPSLVESIEPSSTWNTWRDNLANEMFRAWSGN